MSLIIKLGTEEWIMIGNAKVMNVCPERTAFAIDGAAPVLRAANVLNDETADTPAKRAYISVQKLYFGMKCDMVDYFARAGELIAANPSAAATAQGANAFIDKGSIYRALRDYRKLFA